jgi:hypothetical protein
MLEPLKERDSYQLNRCSCLSVADLECTCNPTLEFIIRDKHVKNNIGE